MTPTTLRFNTGGSIDCLYTEAIDLRALGRLQVFRATDIRFCEKSQQWNVRCAATGKLLHSDPSRDACLVFMCAGCNALSIGCQG